LVSARVAEAAAALDAQPIDFPDETGTYPLFMREVADVHRELYTEHADLYGEDVAVKIERCLDVSEAEANAAERARAEYRERAAAALDGFDLLLTPTVSCVAPRVGIGDAALREELIRFTYPFNALGWPALALPCGDAEDGLPASAQLIGKPGTDALVLAVGERLEQRLREE
jgi:Asp-tRNA(Asn)/Glu-tRNA(Gln) amidotransferase A subunit family amidase